MSALQKSQKISKLLFFLSQLLKNSAGDSIQSRAYANAAKEILKYDTEISIFKTYKEMGELPYIGESIVKNIMEYYINGKFPYFEQVLTVSKPIDILKLSDQLSIINAKKMIETLHINSYSEILNCFNSNEIERYCKKNLIVYKNLNETLELLSEQSHFESNEIYVDKEIHHRNTLLLKLDQLFRSRNPFDSVNIGKTKYKTDYGEFVYSYSNSENAIQSNEPGDWVNVHLKSSRSRRKWIILTSNQAKTKGRRIVVGDELNEVHFYDKFKKHDHSQKEQIYLTIP